VYYLRRPSSAALFLVGVATGFSVLTKWLPGLLVIAVLLLLLLYKESWKKAVLHCCIVFAIAVIVFIPWQVFIYSAFPKEAAWESYFNYKHLFEPLDGHDGTVLYQLAMMPRIFGELIYVPLLVFFYALYKKELSADKFVLVFWFALPYLFFSLVATKMPGYVMISAPPIFIMLSWAFWAINERMKNPKYRIATMFLLALLILLPIRYSIERVKPFENKDRNPGWTKELRKLEDNVGASKAAVFNVEHYIEAMFYAKVSAYPFIPDQKQIDQAVGRGFKVFIYEDSRIPPEIRRQQNVFILSHD
jgi:4-amino-4-deoxy-L-arabinose transferase